MSAAADPRGSPGEPPRVVAFYLPQFHPIPENDEWWGEGFTEWTNVAGPRPLLPRPLPAARPGATSASTTSGCPRRGRRRPTSRAPTASPAFCYYHYWFAGRRLLERPFDEVLASRRARLPVLPLLGERDLDGDLARSAQARADRTDVPGTRRPPRPLRLPRPVLRGSSVSPRRRQAPVHALPTASVAGHPARDRVLARTRPRGRTRRPPHGRVVVARPYDRPASAGHGRDLVRDPQLHYHWNRPVQKVVSRVAQWMGLPYIYRYRDMVDDLLAIEDRGDDRYPCVIPNWDNTPRSGRRGLVFVGDTPALLRRQVDDAFRRARRLPESRRLVFVKSWNEWAEGNHLEPDHRDGLAYLEVFRDAAAVWRGAGPVSRR